MMDRELWVAELQNVTDLEMKYRECAELVAPACLDENPVPLARAYMTALRGIERCVELRIKLAREAGGMPEPEPEEQMMMIDLGKLSDQALREVEMALMPEKISDNDENQAVVGTEVCEKSKKKTKITPLEKEPKIKPKTVPTVNIKT